MSDHARRLKRLELALICERHQEPLQCLSCARDDRQSPEARAQGVRERILAKLDEMDRRQRAAKGLTLPDAPPPRAENS